jgi:hypothetical protein
MAENSDLNIPEVPPCLTLNAAQPSPVLTRVWIFLMSFQIIALVLFALALVAIAFTLCNLNTTTDGLREELRTSRRILSAEITANKAMMESLKGDIKGIHGFFMGYNAAVQDFGGFSKLKNKTKSGREKRGNPKAFNKAPDGG